MSLPPRRALIVIDVQNEYVSGKLRIEFPPVEESLANIGQAIDAAQQAGIPVIVVQNSAPESSPLFARGSAGWKLHPVVGSRSNDHLIEKTLPSAFAGIDLVEWLQGQQIDTLTVAGYMTHNCDASTIIDAMHRGLSVEFLADASGALPYKNEAGFASAEDIHRIYAVVLHSRFAAVASTASWIAATSAALPLPRGNILASHEAAVSGR